MLDAADAAIVGAKVQSNHPKRTVQAVVSGDGAVTAEVEVQGSNDGVNFLTLATISLSGTDLDQDGCALESPWKWIQVELTSITGTDAVCTVTMETQP
jgi:hypothetical protein